MNYFLDTNICSYYLDGKFPLLLKKMHAISKDNIKIPSIVAAELFYGAAKSVKAEYNLQRFEKFLSAYKIIRFDKKAAKIYGEIRADLEKRGQIIGGNDIIVAAIALSQKGVLVTHNVKEFSRVNSLVIEDWTENQN